MGEETDIVRTLFQEDGWQLWSVVWTGVGRFEAERSVSCIESRHNMMRPCTRVGPVSQEKGKV